MQKLKVNDEVVILAGKDKGKTGTLSGINKKKGKVLVKGVNIIRKAVRPNQQNPEGGFVEIERPLHRSNIALVDPKTKGPTRVRIEERDGKRVRVAVKSGTVLGQK